MKQLTITHRASLKPTFKTRKQLQFVSSGCNFVYNWALEERIEADKQGLKQPSKFQQTKDLTALKKQKEYEWLNKICAWTLQEIVKNRVPSSWSKYEVRKKFCPQAKYPRIKTDKGWHDSFSVYYYKTSAWSSSWVK